MAITEALAEKPIDLLHLALPSSHLKANESITAFVGSDPGMPLNLYPLHGMMPGKPHNLFPEVGVLDGLLVSGLPPVLLPFEVPPLIHPIDHVR